MKTPFFQLIIFLLLFSLNNSFTFAQSEFDPTFDSFKGTARKLQFENRYAASYHPNCEEAPIISTFEWTEIDIPETDIKIPFPDVPGHLDFTIIFESNMTIKKKGVYKFSLTSDDGSILWIGKKAVVLNDKTHQMRFKEDSISLSPGVYPIKIWYFQGFPDRYGIQFKSSYYRDLKEQEMTTSLEVPRPKNLKLVIPNQILNFEYDSYQVNTDAKIFLDSIANKILSIPNIGILRISGHTDNAGNDIYNAELSMKRAITIQEELDRRIKNPLIKYEVKGWGESRPINLNDSDENRSKNRRVEIEIVLDQR